MGTIFSTDDIRGNVDDTLTTEYAWNVGKGLAEWLPDEGSVVLTVSSDANNTTVHAITEGLLLQGRNVIDMGEGDMQSVIASVSDKQAAGGVLITHDTLDNLEIISLFDSRGIIITDQSGLDQIGELVDAGNFVPAARKGTKQ